MFSYRSDNGKMLMGKIPKKAKEVAKEVLKVYVETNMIEKESCQKDGICFFHSRPYVDKLFALGCNKTIMK